MIYLFLKRIVKWSFFFFFRKKVVGGLENIPKNGSLIIAINHPNTLIDPLLVASQIKRRVGFLANASIFINNVVKAFFNYFWVIPVYRKKDVKPGELQDNESSFRKCFEFFDREGALLIFPEGTSVNELKLRDIKTGTARIALGYEAMNNFEGELKIVTAAISYSDSLRFRSMVSIVINPAFEVKEYQKDWEENEDYAIKSLTNRIKKDLEGQITLTENKEQEKVVLEAQQFYLAYVDPEASRFHNVQASFDYRKKMAVSLRTMQKEDVKAYDLLRSKLEYYFKELSSLKLTIGFFKDSFLSKNAALVVSAYFVQLILLFPIYITGLLFNYIPYRIPLLLFNAIKPDIEYRASIMLMVGMIIFPIYYTIIIIIFRSYFTSDLIWTLLLLLLMPILGYLVLFFWKIWKRFNRVIHFYKAVSSDKKEEMIMKRNKLLELVKPQ